MDGDDNTAVGSSALSLNRGSHNTAIGRNALVSNNTGNNNTALGNSANVSSGNLTNASAIGYNATVELNHSMKFGNSDVTTWGFGSTPGLLQALKVGSNGFNGNGAFLSTGGVWVNGSSMSFKENFQILDGSEILKKISVLNIRRWRYKGAEREYHIGPIAEEFYRLFNVGIDEKYLSTIDPSGVALIGIQQLTKVVTEQKAIIMDQNKKIEMLIKEIQAIKEKMK